MIPFATTNKGRIFELPNGARVNITEVITTGRGQSVEFTVTTLEGELPTDDQTLTTYLFNRSRLVGRIGENEARGARLERTATGARYWIYLE